EIEGPHLVGLELAGIVSHVVSREEGEDHEIGLIGEPPSLEHAKLLSRSESGYSEIDDVDVLRGSERTGYELLLEKPPEGPLHVGLQSLRVRVAQHDDAIGARRLRHGTLAIMQTLRVCRDVRLAFLSVPAGRVRPEAQSCDGVWLMKG